MNVLFAKGIIDEEAIQGLNAKVDNGGMIAELAVQELLEEIGLIK